MGCDIHLFVEKRESEGAPWTIVPAPIDDGWRSEPDPDNEGRSRLTGGPSYRYHHKLWTDETYEEPWTTIAEKGEEVYRNLRGWYDSRDYALFAALAGVRDYHGANVWSEPRGIPEDASAEYAEQGNDCDGHSHSYFTLAELLAKLGDDAAPVKHGGMMPATVYAAWKASGDTHPETWSQGASGPNIKHITEARYAALQEVCAEWPELSFDRSKAYVTGCEWTEPANERFKDFSALLAELQPLAPNPEDVRLVFYFDN